MTTICFSGATSAAGRRRCGGQADVEPDPAVDVDARLHEVLERLLPDREHRVGGGQRVAQLAGLLGVELLGLLAVARGGEVEVAGHPQQLVRADRAARPALAVGDVGLDRAEVAAAVEDDGQRVAQRQAADPERDRSRGVLIDQGTAEEVVGVVVHVHLSAAS